MISKKHLQSARTNGARSRGPVTAKGKQISAQNSQRHGMLAQTVVLIGESQERFLALLSAFVAEYKPQTEAEHALVETMAVARWRQLRTWGIQKSDFDREMARLEGAPVRRAAIAFRNLADQSRSMDLVHRYETSYDRQFLRALKRLEDMHARRPGNVEEPNFLLSIASATFEEEEPAEIQKFRNEPSLSNAVNPG